MKSAKRYTAAELSGMGLKALAKAGADVDLTFNKNHKKSVRVSRILAAYAERDVELSSVDTKSPPSAPTQQAQGEPNPRFESLCHDDGITPPSTVAGGTSDDDRGGVRPGPGRPEGLTDEISLYNRLPLQPHPAVKQFLQSLFKTWATKAHCREIALTEPQAVELALPYTQALYLLGWLDRIPPWAVVGVMLIWSTWNIVGAKAKLAREAAAKRKAVDSVRNDDTGKRERPEQPE